VSHDDKQRRLDNEGMDEVRQKALEWRKRAAFRVLDSGGTVQAAAESVGACARTVRGWIAERNKA
jgi:hypothetical protein